MANNSNLSQAKKAKQDEFYTLLPEIAEELNHYVDKFKGEVVYCNCDDPFESNFVKYFLMNFNRLGLKELIATGYSTSPIRGTEVDVMEDAYALRVSSTDKYLAGTQKDLDAAGAKYFLEAEKDKIATKLIGNFALDSEGNQIQVSVKEKYADEKGKTRTRTIKEDLYYEAGDFRSDMSVELLKQSTIVVTNTPFSLFREYVAQLIKYKKKFLILGNMNAITYKEIFPLIKDNRIWVGYGFNMSLIFKTPYPNLLEANRKFVISKGYNPDKGYIKTPAICWFTNIDHEKRHEILPIDLGFTYYGHEDYYPKYDNYDAINVNKVNEIPCDYEPCWYKCPCADNCEYAKTEGRTDNALCEKSCNGKIGVPITYLDKHCPEQFEIIGADLDLANSMKEIAEDGTYEKGGPAFYIKNELAGATPPIYPEEIRQTLQENYRSQDTINATESLEFQSPSSTNIAQNNSESFGKASETQEQRPRHKFLNTSNTDDTKKTEADVLSSKENVPTVAFLFKKCNGIMGVPITFLDKYCPEQFEILGTSDNGIVPKSLKLTDGLTQQFVDNYYSSGGKGSYRAGNPTAGLYQNGTAMMIYKRLFIRNN